MGRCYGPLTPGGGQWTGFIQNSFPGVRFGRCRRRQDTTSLLLAVSLYHAEEWTLNWPGYANRGNLSFRVRKREGDYTHYSGWGMAYLMKPALFFLSGLSPS